eukprot:TRINITY_DN2010_c0_g1_i1.p1 TRINITY_DN2010_c0_g1~~TRINITY_DN2010_c0_g1_i1.p1  ORF type:complete len:918 (-),score=315.05 TRINITY_DN2010_c0_g1_i1:282-3035(-)
MKLFFTTCLIWLQLSQAQIMSVDLGHEFFKVALMRQGVPLEIVLNSHSKRKTSTAVSFFEQSRVFGDDALGHMGKAPTKVPVFYHGLLGENFTEEDMKDGGKYWEKFALSRQFYQYNMGYDAERGVPTFKLGDDLESAGEEVLASVLFACKKMCEETTEGKPVRDLVVTVPANAGLRFRQAIAAAGEAAGLRLLSLVHETSAFAVQRAVDVTPEKGASDVRLFYNLGSRKVEVSVVKFESRAAGMVAGKQAPVLTVLASASENSIGGHLMDVRLAEAMLKRFQEKFPKMADSVLKDPRALRKLLSQAQKTKATLSANKVGPFIVESLHQDTDFQTTVTREEFTTMCKDMFDRLTDPVKRALEAANITMKDIKEVEVVGGAWRVPKVQEMLSAYFKAEGGDLPLGQHLNGEEAAAMGAALMAANFSSSFRVKKIFFSDYTSHEYAVQVAALDGSWEKNLTKLYAVGAPQGGKKKLSFSTEEDFKIKLFEDGILMSEYEVTGLKDLLEGKWKDYNRSGSPKITASVPLEMSGLIEVKKPLVTVEEHYWVNKTKEKPKPNKTKESNSTENATDGEKKDEEKKDEEKKEEAKTEETAAEEEPEVIWTLKTKKHEKKLKVSRVDYRPKPVNEEQMKAIKTRLEALAKKEEQYAALAGLKNELEAAIYGSRDKLERDDMVKVSTEEQREEITKLCTELEDFMYETGSTNSDYESRLTKLKDLMAPIEERALEYEARADIPDTVKEELDSITEMKKLIEKDMKWVGSDKLDPATEKITKFQEWWDKKLIKQKELALSEVPAYTKKEVIEKLAAVKKEWEKLKKIKKPKAEKKKKDDKKGKDKDDKKEDDLPKDVAAVEKELAELQEKKMKAVESEDFDAAHSLKQREKTLKDHLEKLKGSDAEGDKKTEDKKEDDKKTDDKKEL